jgi:CheY-specific phosphatase CheX
MGRIQEDLERLAEQACIELFTHYNMPLKPVAAVRDQLPGFSHCAIVGFGGANLSGAVIFACTEGLLLTCIPEKGNCRDWLGELTNQIVGNFKHQLRRCGVLVYSSLPTVVNGHHLAPFPRDHLLPICLMHQQDYGYLWVDSEAAADFVLHQDGSEQAGAGPGEMVLF